MLWLNRDKYGRRLISIDEVEELHKAFKEKIRISSSLEGYTIRIDWNDSDVFFYDGPVSLGYLFDNPPTDNDER